MARPGDLLWVWREPDGRERSRIGSKGREVNSDGGGAPLSFRSHAAYIFYFSALTSQQFWLNLAARERSYYRFDSPSRSTPLLLLARTTSVGYTLSHRT